jgi:hypothetical protein
MPQFKLNPRVKFNIADNLQDCHEACQGYIEAIYFTDTGDSEQPASDLEMAVASQLKAMSTVIDFITQVEAAGLLLDYFEHDNTSWHQLGVDLWLTQNRHGCGFWGRGLGELGDRLTDIAKHCGSVDTYEGDDGLIYLS